MYDETWKAPPSASLTLDVLAQQPNTLVVMIDDHAAEVLLKGGEEWQQIALEPKDFRDQAGAALANWENIKLLKLSDTERLKGKQDGSQREVGKAWKGPAPQFRKLRWNH